MPIACPEMPPVECRPESIVCSGGMDSIGCMMPDVCMPMGTECPAMAPACHLLNVEMKTLCALGAWTLSNA